MTIKISGAGPPIDPRTIKIQSPNRKSAPEIDFSRPFRGFDWSDHPSVKGLIDEIFEAYVFWYRECIHGERIRNPGTIRQYLTHFVLEAYRVHVAQPGMMLGVALGKDHYRKTGDRYHQKHITSYDGVKKVTDFLVAGDYLEMPFGKAETNPDPKYRKTTRYRATDRLIGRCEAYRIHPLMIRPYADSEVIILRKPKEPGQSRGDLLDYEETGHTEGMRENVLKINKKIAEHYLDLDIFDHQEADLLRLLGNRDEDNFLDFTQTRLRRIFNNASFEQGGRFYGGWWMSVPSDFRSRITIDNEPTVELDYSGMHFAVMYAEKGMDIPMKDPYALDGYGEDLRDDIKTAFNIIVNCDSRGEAIRSINRRIRKGKLSGSLGSGRKLMEAFAEAHPLIKDKIANGEGIRGQYTESRIAEKVLLKGLEKGMCILPMHDGFITKKKDEPTLMALMDDAFREIAGRKPRIKHEAFDLSVLPHAGEYERYLVRRPDGKFELNGPLEGKAISFSPLSPELPHYSKKNKEEREKAWKEAHGE